jgi:hypothetical protein
MEAEIFSFEEFNGSGKSLLAAPYLVGNTLLTAADVEAITYKIKKMSDSSEVTGSVPLDAMLAVPAEWNRDEIGYTFQWDAPGTLWPDAGEVYRIIITFTLIAALGGGSFKKVWEVTTVDPES